MTIIELANSFLQIKIGGNDPLYNLMELNSTLLDHNIEVKDDNCVITPFYVSNGKKFELYLYELVIESGYESFDERVIASSGIEELSTFNEQYRIIRNKCTYGSCSSTIILDWISYISKNRELIDEVENVFLEKFDVHKVYIAIY